MSKSHKVETDMIVTRLCAQEIAAVVPDGADELDLSSVQFVNASGLDELMRLLPHCTFAGMNRFTAETYEWVLEARKRIAGEKENAADEQSH